MDSQWERSIPFCPVTAEEAGEMLGSMGIPARVDRILPIQIGCRSSNYRLETGRGEYLLRICADLSAFQSEQAAFEALGSTVRMPALLGSLRQGDRAVLLYKYIPSVSLAAVAEAGGLPEGAVRQAAQNAARIHNFPPEKVGGLLRRELPPFSLWFDLFLSNERAAKRLGEALCGRIRALVAGSGEAFSRIDSRRTLIHSDYRPANMLLTPGGEVYVTDWEYLSAGHPLADIGQFFRYRNHFSERDFAIFADAYHAEAAVPLPEDWYALSLLRDLVNPLQMLGGQEDCPKKYADLKAVALATVQWFGY